MTFLLFLTHNCAKPLHYTLKAKCGSMSFRFVMLENSLQQQINSLKS